MKKKYSSRVSETEKSVSQSSNNKQPVWEQLDLFEWSKINDETEVGFAVRNGL
jgi:hypothetical protein